MAPVDGSRRRWRWRDQLPPVRSARLTRRRRWALRHAGRKDGRAGKPEFTTAGPGVTTDVRVGIEREMLAQIEQVKQIYGERNAELEHARTEAETRLGSLREELARGREALAAAEARRPDPTRPLRRRGETNQSEEVVRARRQREYDRRLQPLRDRLDRLANEETDQIDRRDRMAATLAALDAERERVERWVTSMQLHARAIYDQALLRRHPYGDHVGPLMDGARVTLPAWPLPDWLTRPPTMEERRA
jgi:hypothetical protein